MYLDELKDAQPDSKRRGFYSRLHATLAPDVSWGTVMRATRREPLHARTAKLISEATGGKVSVLELTAPEADAVRPIVHRRKRRKRAA
jgi:hypothetical protein